MGLPISGSHTRHDKGWSLRPLMTLQIDDPDAPDDLPKEISWRPSQRDHESALRQLKRPLFALAEASAGGGDHASGVTWTELLAILVPDSAARLAAMGGLTADQAASIALAVLEARAAIDAAALESP